MTFTPTWFAVERHAKDRIEEIRTALETAPIDAVIGLQAEARALRSVLTLPVTLNPGNDLEPEVSGY